MNKSYTEDFLNTPSEAFSFEEHALPKEIAARFNMVELIGHNEFGETIVMSEKDTKNLYVLKSHRNIKNPAQSEGVLLQGLEYEGIPSFESLDDERYSIRKYIEGLPLNEYLKKYKDEQNSIDIIIKLCDILIFLHSRSEPIIHRDIKPSNIIINPKNNQVTLIDFGISRKYSADSEADTTHFGTQKFAPPEQYGFAQTDCRSDIYSVGVLLRYLLTGKAERNLEIEDKALAKIVTKCTALAPEMRYQSAAAVKKALNNYKNRTKRQIVTSVACILSVVLIFATGIFAKNYEKPLANILYEFSGEIMDTGNFTFWRDIPEDILNIADIMVVEYTGTPPTHSSSYTFARHSDWQEFKIGHSRIIAEDDKLIFDLRGLEGNNLAFAFWDTLYEQSIERMYLTTYAQLGIESLDESYLQPPYEYVSQQPHDFPYVYLGEIADKDFTLWENIPWSVLNAAEVMVVEYESRLSLPHYSFVRYLDWQQFSQGDSRITAEDGLLIFDLRELDGSALGFAFWGNGNNAAITRMYITTYALLGTENVGF
ncbi:MAG: protein kinase [Oscillospiraceae bacterium]|nr:protein kinase [Oscillospiraceae bacterium]